jgi:hypothetical protein
MKAKLVDSMPTGESIYEIKFDGYRALALRGGSETRSYRGTKRKDVFWCHNSEDKQAVREIAILVNTYFKW